MNKEQILFDEVLSNALDVLRLSAGERAKVIRQLVKMEKELIAELETADLQGKRRKEIEIFLKRADKIIGAHFGEIADSLPVKKLSQSVAQNTVHTLQVALGVEAVDLPIADYFASLASNVLIQGAPSADWWRGQSADTTLKFAAQVRQGLANGETNQQIVARIVGKSGEPGIMDVVKRNAQALVNTSVQTVANDARRATYKANSDIVKGLEQVSTLDSHTSLICVGYSGAKWDLDFKPIEGTTLPYNGGVPRHWNCRSVELPITKTFRELGINIDEPKPTTRASDEGQIKADTTFDGFLKRKGDKYQNELLGKDRAQLWRDGKITLKDLIGASGRPLSIDELLRKVKKK